MPNALANKSKKREKELKAREIALKSEIYNKCSLIKAHKMVFFQNKLDFSAALPGQYPLLAKFEEKLQNAELLEKKPLRRDTVFEIYTKLNRIERELCSILVQANIYPKEYLYERD